LRLNNNQLTGEIPESICDLNIEWSSSWYFDISNNQLCPPYPSCIEDYMGYQDVCSCGLDDDEVVYLWGNCYSIEYTTELDLSNSGLTGEIPSEIGNLTNLTELDLSENQLTGSIPPEIGNLINLSGGITSGLYVPTFHPGLNLSDNLLTGSIPPEIGNLTNLTFLDLHNNQLTGTIPSEIGNLTNLIGLYLSENQLRGVIPDSICELTNLTWYSSTTDWFTPISSIRNNQLCPPYPSCIEDYVGEQDTSDCD